MERYTYEITFTRLDGQPTRPSSTPMRGLPENASGFSMSRTAPRCTAASA